MTNTCESCQYIESDGTCHRYPPTLFQQGVTLTASWPPVAYDDWCGEYQAAPPPVTLTITSLTPSTLAAGSTPATVTIAGTGFDNTCYVRVNGETRATFYISTTELQYTARPDLATSGQIDGVVVENGSGVQSNSLSFSFT